MLAIALFPLLLFAQTGFPFFDAFPGGRIRAWGSQPETPVFEVISSVDGRTYFAKRATERFPPLPGNDSYEYVFPKDLPVGPAVIQVPGQPETKFQIEIRASLSPALYSLNGPVSVSAQRDVVYAYQQASSALRRNLLTDAAKPGDRIVLWGTGIESDQLEVDIGGAGKVRARVEHQDEGLDRLEFTLPESTPAHCYLPLTIGFTRVSMSTAAPGTSACPHPMELSATDLLRLDRNQRVAMAVIDLSPHSVRITYDNLLAQDFPRDGNIEFPNGPPVFGCRLERRQFQGAVVAISLGFPIRKNELTAPDGTRFTASSTINSGLGFVAAPNVSMWQSGTWKLQIEDEEMAFSVPQLFRWKAGNPDWSQFAMGRDFTIAWDSGASGPNDFVQFLLPFRSLDPTDPSPETYLICAQPAVAGSLTVPAALMSSVPPGSYRTPLSPSVTAMLGTRNFRGPGGRYVSLRYRYFSVPGGF